MFLFFFGFLQDAQPQTVPDAPTAVTATAGKGRVLVHFTAPVNNGGAAITNYDYSTDNGGSWTVQSPASTDPYVLIPTLTNCTAYNIKIRARNSVGPGTASTAVSVTPRSGTDIGITWTSRTSAAAYTWRSITYGNGIFVAVGQSSVMTSTDGSTWTLRTAAASNTWTSVTFGNGQFVAVSDGGDNPVMTSPDGITWTSRSAPSRSWASVTYGNGVYVAVGTSGSGGGVDRVMTSPDGINWTIRNATYNHQFFTVQYGNGLFVALGSGAITNRLMTSTDGATWTARTTADAYDKQYYSMVYANAMFVAVAPNVSGSGVITSSDGINWTSRTTPEGYWYGVTYGNGLFVAVAGGGVTGTRVMTSPDGATWTARNSAADYTWRSVAYGNGLFAAVSSTSAVNDRVMTSFDGLAPDRPVISSITPAATSASVAFTAPADAGSAAITNYEYSTNNGTSWTTPSPASTTSPLTISGLAVGTAYQVQLRAVSSLGSGCASVTTNTTTTTPSEPSEPTGLVAKAGVNRTLVTFTAPSNSGGSAITNYQYSTDNGINWTAQNPASINPYILIPSLTNCTAYNVKIRAVNLAGAGTASSAVSVTPRSGTLSGINWTSRTPAADNNWISITYGNGLFVALSNSGTDRIMTSSDGINWTSRSIATGTFNCITYGNGLYVVAAYGSIRTSPDGITWTSRTVSGWNWKSVTYGNGLFVAVAVEGRVMTSPDGITWTSRTAPTGTTSSNYSSWGSITYGNGLFVAVAYNQAGTVSATKRVMTSPDGTTWTFRDPATGNTTNTWKSVCYGNGLFVAVSSDGTNRVMTSADGITWTARTAAASNSWNCVTYGNGLFVALSGDGTNRVMTSPDGITWTSRTAAAAQQWLSIAYGNGMFVAVSYDNTINNLVTNLVMTSSFDDVVPDKPVISSITPGATSVSVAFTAPAETGSSAITNYEYSTNNGTGWTTRSPVATSTPLSITGLSSGAAYQVQLRAVNTQGSGCASTTVNTTTYVTWTGSTSSDWNTGSNWSSGSVPATGAAISIPDVANDPALDQNRSVGTISISSGSVLSLGANTLTLTGDLTNNGTVSGTGLLKMGGSSTQAMDGQGQISNLTIDNTSGITISSGSHMVNITGVLTPTAGTLTTNGNLTLKSSASGTARVAAGSASGGYVIGNVTVERYIPAGRKWRFLCTPLKGSTNNSVFYHWQNNDVPNGATGVEIWGPAPDGTNDPSSSNNGLAIGANYSMRSYANGWVNVTNTNFTELFDVTTNNGYALFQTGPYNNGSTAFIGTVGNLPSGVATTLSATGSLITGDHTKSLTALNADQYFLVANPYASPVNPASFTGANISNLKSTLYMWDAKQGGTRGLGRYVSYSVTGQTYSTVGAGTGFSDNTVQIQSGQAFFVQSISAGAASLTFRESSKSATGAHDMFGNATTKTEKKVRLFLQEDSSHIDGAVAFFRDGASAGIDAMDGAKLMNSSDNLGLRRDGHTLVFEFRPELKSTDTLYIRLSQMQQKAFRLRVALENFTTDAGLKPELVDKYLRQRRVLSFTDTTDFDFTVTADSASTGDRFLIVFTKPSSTGSGTTEPADLLKMKPYPNPVVSGIPVRIDIDGSKAPWDLKLIDVTGRTVWQQLVKDGTQNRVEIDMSRMGSGVYQLMMIDAKGTKSLSRLLKQ